MPRLAPVTKTVGIINLYLLGGDILFGSSVREPISDDVNEVCRSLNHNCNIFHLIPHLNFKEL